MSSISVRVTAASIAILGGAVAMGRAQGKGAVASPEERGLVGVYWRAVELAGKPTPTQETQQEAHLEFQSGGRFSGADGCNRVTGSYQLAGDRVTFGQVAATQMACLHSSGTEEPFREALKNAARLTVEGDRLELFDAKGTQLAAFVAVSKTSTSSLPRLLASLMADGGVYELEPLAK
jgi:heat shock protein HslJ